MPDESTVLVMRPDCAPPLSPDKPSGRCKAALRRHGLLVHDGAPGAHAIPRTPRIDGTASWQAG